MLKHLLAVNEQKLSQIKLDDIVTIQERTIQAGSNLMDLIRMGRNDKLAVEVLSAVMEVLGAQQQ